MVNILICNGSPQESQDLREMLLKHSGDRIKATIFYEDKEAFLFYLEENGSQPNIVIIDLDFCAEGIKIAKVAKTLNPWSEIVFLCKAGNWTMEVYDVDHVYGLACPLSEEKLELAINRALDKIDENQNTLFPIRKKGIV